MLGQTSVARKLFSKRGWLLLILAIFLFLKLPALFEPFTYGDEGIYLTLGQAAKKGLVWYRDIHDNKPPLLYLIAALAGNFSAYRLIHFAWSLITVILFWQLVKLVFPGNKRAEFFSTLVFTFLTSLHTFEGNIGNAENFMMLPTIAGFFLIYEALSAKSSSRESQGGRPAARNLFKQLSPEWVWLSAGLLFGLASLFKIPAAFDFAAALVFVFLVLLKPKNKNHCLFALRSVLMTIGFLTPILFSVGYYFLKGALKEYLIAAFAQNLPYLSSWTSGSHQTGGLPFALLVRLGLVGAVVYTMAAPRKRSAKAVMLIVVWYAFSWFASLLSSRPYPHYLLQLVPPFSLSIGLLFPLKIKKARETLRFLPGALGLVFYLTFVVFGFWRYPNLEYYQSFYRFLFKQESRTEYWQRFDAKTKNIYEAAAYIRQRTFPDEQIFIWGTEPSIYALSERLPIGRYATSYHVIDFAGQKETLDEIVSKRPRFIIVSDDETRPFPEFFAILNSHYALGKKSGPVKIYHRLTY